MNAFFVKRTVTTHTSRPIGKTGINMLLSFAVMGILVIIPPIAPLSDVGDGRAGCFSWNGAVTLTGGYHLARDPEYGPVFRYGCVLAIVSVFIVVLFGYLSGQVIR